MGPMSAGSASWTSYKDERRPLFKTSLTLLGLFGFGGSPAKGNCLPHGL